LLRVLNEGLRLGPTVGAKVIFVRGLPRMGNGKLDRIGLQRLFRSLSA
jgi:hypothetical protein